MGGFLATDATGLPSALTNPFLSIRAKQLTPLEIPVHHQDIIFTNIASWVKDLCWQVLQQAPYSKWNG